MDHEFWQARWREGRIGFHEGEGSPRLREALSRLTGDRPGAVLVPLCGKSVDMRILAGAGQRVVGVELAESAAVAFFDEWGVTPEIDEQGPFKRYAGQGVTILVGDFFALTPEQLGPVDAAFDRAALVALPPGLRARYAPHLCALLPPGARLLLVTFEYDQSLAAGPPFSVTADEVRSLFGAMATIEHLAEQPVEATSAALREKNAELREAAWLLTRAPSAP